MHWLRRGTLFLCAGIGLSVLALVIHTFWIASPNDPALLGQKVQDLQLLVIILLALTGLYTIVFLLAPSERILKQQAEQVIKTVKAQTSAGAGELRELKEEIRQVMSGQVKAMRELRAEPAEEMRKLSAPANAITGREYLHLSGRLRVLNNELVQVYQALAAICGPQDPATAKSYLNQALSLSADPMAAADIHYSLACLLARHGEMGEAIIEIQTAFMSRSPDLERRLAKDTEEGGCLYDLATREPYYRVLDDLLMDVSVGR